MTQKQKKLLKVIIVDDKEQNRYLLEVMLKNEKFDVTSTSNGKEALQFLKKNKYDLIISDILMPVLDGFQLCKECKTDSVLKNIPFIFYTATYINEQDKKFALSLGADRFIIKPTEPSEFMSVIRELIKEYESNNIQVKSFQEKDEKLYFKKYSKRLFEKLESKIQKLEETNKALVESEERLRLSLKAANQGLYDLNIQTGDAIVNDEYALMLGYDPRTFIESNDLWIQRLHPDEREILSQNYLDYINGKIPEYRIEFRQKTKNGDWKWILSQGKIIETDSNGKPLRMLGIHTDITERKLIEEEIKKLNKELADRIYQRTQELEQKNKELESFSYSVSHDLRAPLRVINGFTQILIEEYKKKLDNEGKKLLDTIRNNAQKMDHLIIGLLALSKISRSKIKFVKIDMDTVIKSIYNEIVPPDIQKKFILSVNPLPNAFGDLVLIKQIWSNLISNAIKYTMKSKIKKIEINGYKEKGYNIFYIKDTGVGFDSEYINKLFGVFQRLHSEKDFEGFGIGLAIVKRIIERHRGKVWAESKLNHGATFYFSLPIKRG